jgi:hypothetical protein
MATQNRLLLCSAATRAQTLLRRMGPVMALAKKSFASHQICQQSDVQETGCERANGTRYMPVLDPLRKPVQQNKIGHAASVSGDNGHSGNSEHSSLPACIAPIGVPGVQATANRPSSTATQLEKRL